MESAEVAPSYRSPLLDRPGAVRAEAPDAGVAAHYGSDLREQRMLAAGGGFVDLSHRDVLTISGPDRLSWLHALTSQYVDNLAPGASTTALILSPTGHVEHALYGVDDGDTFWLHTEPGAGTALLDWLRSMVFMSRVELADVTSSYAIVWRPGPSGGSGGLTRSGQDSLGGHEVFLPRADLAGLDEPAAGVWAYEALRIAAGAPRLGLDTDARAIPNELGWLGVAVHLDKGCYRGQETVARVHNLGRPPRRLVRLHLDGSVDHLPAHGDAVEHDGRQVGFVGSAARHHELGPVALALVKRSVPPEADLTVPGGDGHPTVTATQEALVDPEVGLHVRARL
ncbi:MAG TPA: glycine cleavage T C-terminal barrel domain-containing protein [Kribbellaceae bacterium]|nr:glycine cleavage T C-terminal barrel domain-containing protein [Kribbellaceae bacterium]